MKSNKGRLKKVDQRLKLISKELNKIVSVELQIEKIECKNVLLFCWL